jgi:cyclic pyranopterin phosphate synthase
MDFSHINTDGSLHMVDVSDKKTTKRTAVAQGFIYMKIETIQSLKSKLLKKGDALTAAELAGICGAKKTSELIPLCHTISLRKADISFTIESTGIKATCTCIADDKTGVEMEALTGVSTALLTIYDMCKAIDKEMKITDITILEKSKNEYT